MFALTYVLGAGVSKPAGMPLASEILKKVLCADNVRRESDGHYRWDTEQSRGRCPFSDEYVWRVKRLIRHFSARRDSSGRTPNYEEVYDVLYRLTSEAESTVRDAVPCLEELLKPQEGGLVEEWNARDLIREAMNYIHDGVWQLLIREPKPLDYLGAIVEACKEPDVAHVDIFTLNHDTVLEEELRRHEVEFVDGFGDQQSGVRWWNPQLFDTSSSKVRLFKLHGSVNWFFYSGQRSELCLGIMVGDSQSPIITGPDNRGLIEHMPRPVILMGTDAKRRQKTRGVFKQLHTRFCRNLVSNCSSANVVVAGYGFRDEKINKVLSRVGRNQGARFVVIDKKPSEELKSVLPEEKTTLIKRGIQDVTFCDLARSLARSGAET